MKIIFDIDGTMTDYHAYIEKYAIPWFYKKYNLLPIKPNELELQDIFDLENVIQIKLKCSPSEAKREASKIIDHYWISHRFIHFSLLTRFRPGCSKIINKLKGLGFQVEIYTSRAHTASCGFVGFIARLCTVGQLWLNGVWMKPSSIYYFQSDSDKLAGIFQAKPQLVFDDKVNILNLLLYNNIPSVCIASPYNTRINSEKGRECISDYCSIDAKELLAKLCGGGKSVYLLQAAKSDMIWRRLSFLPLIFRLYFHPVILNADRRIVTNDAVLYAPNHRSTLDPLVIQSVVKENIHWAALLRFFEASDSIFNNSKNPILCKLTAWLFQSLAYFPIERRIDNPNANNITAIRNMTGFLNISQKVGIFGEGTTRLPEGRAFGTFDKSIFVLAQKTKAWIQPVTVYWIKNKRNRHVIVNFGPPFKVENLKDETFMQSFLDIQQSCLRENVEYATQHLLK